MRGKACQRSYALCGTGITPAYAGKSFRKALSPSERRDHPRLCGEKRKLSRLLIFSLGSPPPMRGKVHFAVQRHNVDRITPAYAGKSSPRSGQPER